VIAVLLLPLVVVVGLLVAIAIYIDSPGPVLFRSIRTGAGGVPFVMLKFRKMHRDADNVPVTLGDDERFTPIGRFLSATRLDELPQLYNVFQGDMRLVGPRPELACFVAEFAEQYASILTVAPGITGHAQLRFFDEHRLLSGPDPRTAYAEIVMPEKIRIDLDYVRTHSLRGDLAILVRTAALPFRLFTATASASGVSLQWCFGAAATVGTAIVASVLAASRLS